MDLPKKLMLIGLGALSVTKEKTEKILNDLAEKGQVSSEETKNFLKELQDKGERERGNLKESIQVQVEELSKQLNLVTKDELREIDERLKRLEAQIFPSNLSE